MEAYGWEILAHEVAEYTKCTFFEVMDRRAIEIAGMAVLIEAHSEYNKLGQKK
jgi:hypothetical protein